MACDVVWSNFSSVIQQYTQNLVTDLSLIISEEKKVSKDEILHIWNEIAPDYTIGIKAKPINPKKTIDKQCEYKGTKNGTCNLKVSANCKKGKYCFRHNKPETEKEEKSEETTTDINTTNTTKRFRIKFNRKAKLYMDEEHGYVFDRLTKSAYGKYIDGEVKTLTNEDKEIVKSYGGMIYNNPEDS